jgi:integrase
MTRARVDRVSHEQEGLAVTAPAATAAKKPPLPRRRPVRGHPGIYYRPRPDGKVTPPYELSYLDSDGKRRWEVIHGSLNDAEAKRAELRLRRRRGERIQPCRQTFAHYAEEWLDRQTVKPRTLEIYSWALRKHLTPYFGRRRLDQITVDDIAAFIAQMNAKNLKGWTITSALRPLSIILGQAARKGQIAVNPMSQLERGERPKHDDQRDKRILSLQEMQELLAHTEETEHRLLLELLLTAGTRIGEALGLTVGDLNPKDSIIRVEYQLARDGTRTPLKTAESRRAIDIPEQLMKQILELAASHGSLFNPQAFVFKAEAVADWNARPAVKHSNAPPEPRSSPRPTRRCTTSATATPQCSSTLAAASPTSNTDSVTENPIPPCASTPTNGATETPKQARSVTDSEPCSTKHQPRRTHCM